MGLIRLEFGSCSDKIALAIPETISATTALNKPKLLDQVRIVIGRKQYSVRTEQAYT